MDDALYQRIRMALEKSWSGETSIIYSPDAFPSYGQCAQTAILIQERFGGEILRTTGWHGRGNHSTTESLVNVSISRPINLLCPTTPTTSLTKIRRPVLLKQPKRHGLVKSKRFDAHLTRCFRMIRPNTSVPSTRYSGIRLLQHAGEL